MSISSQGDAGLYSDDFNDGSLNAIWTEYDPQNDSTVSFEDTDAKRVVLTVPGTSDHTFWYGGTPSGPTALRIGQAVTTDEAFEVTVAWSGTATEPDTNYQGRGLYVRGSEDSGGTYLKYENHAKNAVLRIDVLHGGDPPTGSRSLGAGFSGTDAYQEGDDFWMRLTRTNVQASGVADWVASWSTTGSSFTTFHSWTSNNAGTSDHPVTPTEVGIYSSDDVNGYVAKADEFILTGSPIGGAPSRRVMVIS